MRRLRRDDGFCAAGRVLSAAAISALLAACRSVPPADPVAARPIAWAEVQAAGADRGPVLPGVVDSVRQAPLSFDVPGRIASIERETGAPFEEGALLARLEDRTFALDLRARESELAEARAVQQSARQSFERQSALRGRDLGSVADLDAAEAELKVARARVAVAEAHLAIARERLLDTELRAPYRGVVARRLAEPEQRVVAGEVILEVLGQVDALEVNVDVPETMIEQLRGGSRHVVTFPACGDDEAVASIKEIGPDASTTGTFPVALLIDTPPCPLRPGMTAEVSLGTQERPEAQHAEAASVSIPITAFVSGEGDALHAYVFRPHSNASTGGILERRTLELERISADRAYVTAGLVAGEIVVARGAAFVKDGQRVRLLGRGASIYQ
ncbi:MAG: efflux RND transporter periplasmic adaptor subunit [Pseudohaliea sp.]|jgi:RND family efflux transporter MFP subunit